MENILNAGRAPTLADIAASLSASGRLQAKALISHLRSTGRTELLHYAGAAHRDPVAWHLCAAYLADPEATEAVLKSRAIKAAWGIVVPPAAFEVFVPADAS